MSAAKTSRCPKCGEEIREVNYCPKLVVVVGVKFYPTTTKRTTTNHDHDDERRITKKNV
jgi:hypothetical protein